MDASDIWPEGNNVPLSEPLLPPALKRTLLVLGCVIMLALVLSAFLVVYPVGDIIHGKLQSTLLEDDVLRLEEFTIYFENGTARQLEELYLEEQEAEFSVCLQGKRENRDYYVASLYVPRIYRQAFNQVSFEPCKGSLIILHTHPYKSCLASAQDMRLLEKSQEENPDALMVVMCEPRRFSVYS